MALKSAIVRSLGLQAVCALLSMLVLDLGQTLHEYRIALVCQWAIIGIIALRRRRSPSRVDLFSVQYGIILLVGIVKLVRITVGQ